MTNHDDDEQTAANTSTMPRYNHRHTIILDTSTPTSIASTSTSRYQHIFSNRFQLYHFDLRTNREMHLFSSHRYYVFYILLFMLSHSLYLDYEYHADNDTTTDSHQCQDKRSVLAPQVCILGTGYVSFTSFFMNTYN